MAYQYRKTITIDYTKCGTADSTDFPVLISHTDANLKSVGYGGHVSNPLGYDINFYSDSGLTTALSYEVETYDPSTGQIIAWVKVPTLSATVNTVIYIGYGDPLISTFQSTSTSVWNANYKGVYHNKTAVTTDSTINAFNLTNFGTTALTSTSTAGGGVGDNVADFGATDLNRYLSYATNMGNTTDVFSMTGLGKLRSEITAGTYDLGQWVNSTRKLSWEIQYDYNGGTRRFGVFIYNGASNASVYYNVTLGTTNWFHWGVTCNGTTAYIYLNGVQQGSVTIPTTSSYTTAGNNVQFGGNTTVSNYFGYLDECRYSNSQRSSSWMTTEYNNYLSTSTFYNLSSEVAIYNLNYKRAITIDYTKCGTADSTDFPVLVSFTDVNFKSVANGGKVQNANGYDIKFYSDAGLTNQLFWEIEKYVPTTGECIFWVKVPTLSATANTIIYVSYGDNTITTFQSTASSVWSNGFAGVWHLKNGTTLSGADSTSNANNGTIVGALTATTGKINGAMQTPTSNSLQYIYAANSTSLKISSKITISCWIRVTGYNGSTGCIVQKRQASNPAIGYNYGFWIDATGHLLFQFNDGSYRTCTDTSVVSLNTWYYVTVAVDETAGTKLTFYQNGSSTSTPAYAGTMPSSGTERVEIGNYTYLGTGQFFTLGIIDELRISNVTRVSSWLLSEYNNQNSPSTFFTLGNEIITPTISNISTTTGIQTITL